MAGVVGGNAGYATLSPIQGNPTGEAMAYVDNLGFKLREERSEEAKARAAADKAKRDAADMEWKESQEFSEKNPFVATGTGLDNGYRQSFDNLYKGAAQARRNYKSTGDPKYLAAFENIKNNAKSLSEIPKAYNALKDDLVKNIENYNPTSAKAKAKILDQINNGQIVQTVDENGNAKFTVFERDAEGKIRKLPYKELTGTQLLAELTPEKSFNIDGESGKNGDSLIKSFQENIGKPREIEESKNGRIVKTTFSPGANDLAKIMAADAVKDKSKLYELVERIGLDPEDKNNLNNPEVIKKASEWLEDKLLSVAPKTVAAKTDYQGLNYGLAREKFQHEKSEDAIDNARKDKESDFSISDEHTVLKNKSVDGVRMSDGTKAFDVKGAMLGKEGKGSKATTLLVSPKGKMFLRVQDVGFEGDTKRTERLTPQGKRNIQEYLEKFPKDKGLQKYKYLAGDKESVSTTDKTPKGRLLDFGKDASEIKQYLPKGETLNSIQDKYAPAKKTENSGSGKTISRSDISSKAKAAGYSAKEYEALLIKNGVTIK